MENKKTETCVFSKLSKKIADIEISLGKLNECLKKIKEEHKEEEVAPVEAPAEGDA